MSTLGNPGRPRSIEVARSIAVDLAILGGCGLLSYGAWLTYRPAGFIVLGLAFLLAGLNGARR